MAEEKIIFFLSPGQQAPAGSTGIALENGGIVWIGEEGTFPQKVSFGKVLPTDITPSDIYNKRSMTVDEITEHENAKNQKIEIEKL